jgi:GntR family transcriptional regulator
LHTGSPLIELVRVVYDQAGRGVEYLHALYRPDRYSFEFDLMRSGVNDARSWAPVVGQTTKKTAHRPAATIATSSNHKTKPLDFAPRR